MSVPSAWCTRTKRPDIRNSPLKRSDANFHLSRLKSLASPAVEMSQVLNAYLDGSSFVASRSRPFSTPWKLKRDACSDRTELLTRCQQIALGTYNVFHPCTHARQQISTSSYPNGSRSSNPPNFSKNALRTIMHAAEAMNTGACSVFSC